jgi:hypothetical protein
MNISKEKNHKVLISAQIVFAFVPYLATLVLLVTMGIGGTLPFHILLIQVLSFGALFISPPISLILSIVLMVLKKRLLGVLGVTFSLFTMIFLFIVLPQILSSVRPR